MQRCLAGHGHAVGGINDALMCKGRLSQQNTRHLPLPPTTRRTAVIGHRVTAHLMNQTHSYRGRVMLTSLCIRPGGHSTTSLGACSGHGSHTNQHTPPARPQRTQPSSHTRQPWQRTPVDMWTGIHSMVSCTQGHSHSSLSCILLLQGTRLGGHRKRVEP